MPLNHADFVPLRSRCGWCLAVVGVLLFWTPLLPLSELTIRFPDMRHFMTKRFNTEAVQRLDAWQQQLTALRDVPEVEKVRQINAFFHQHIRYRSDQTLYAEPDYWATPLELLGHGLGDCEDWAIAQYISLRQLGVTDEKLRLIYVRAHIGGPQSSLSEAHMVLGYYARADAQPLILDSLISQVLPASERSDLTPVFSFNSAGLWAGQGSRQANASPTARLSRWRGVLERVQAEGVSFR